MIGAFIQLGDGRNRNLGPVGYLVQENGCVFLPLLGSLAVAAQTPQQVQDHLIALYKMSMGRNAKVSIVLTEREPIYIVGSIKKPGTYRYAPGMTVMHAVALSDGLEGLNSDFSSPFSKKVLAF